MATIKIGGRPYLDTAAAPKIEDLLSVNGALKVYVDSLAAGEDQSLDVQHVAPYAEPYRVTADGQVITGPCIVYGFVTTAGTSPTLALYDGTSTSGTLIYGGGATETAGAIKNLSAAIYCATGLYADVGGTSPAFTVYALAAA